MSGADYPEIKQVTDVFEVDVLRVLKTPSGLISFTVAAPRDTTFQVRTASLRILRLPPVNNLETMHPSGISVVARRAR